MQSLCSYCGKEFNKKYKTQQYCCRECQYASMRKVRPMATCKTCGKEYTVYRTQLKGLYCSRECSFNDKDNPMYDNFKQMKEEQINKSKKRKEIKRLVSQLKREIKRLNKLNKQIEKKKLFIESHTKNCVVCNRTFVAKNINYLCCSSVCSKKREHVAKDKRIYKNGKPDLSITLKRLYIKHHGICSCCNIVCDWEDVSVRDDGTIVAGETYPSTDHVIPIAKGGKHEWDNVQLMCRRCNSLKSDKVV